MEPGTVAAAFRSRRTHPIASLISSVNNLRYGADRVLTFNLRLRAAYRFAGCDISLLEEVDLKIEELTSDMESAYERWLKIEYDHSPNL